MNRIRLKKKIERNQKFFMIFLFIFFAYSENLFPPIKLTKNGIFNWFNALALMKKPFNNKKIFGFRANSSVPDLSMILSDVLNHLNIAEINVTSKINEMINPDNEVESTLKLLDEDDDDEEDDECLNRSGNVYQLCKLIDHDFNFEKAGIQEKHVDILIANVVGYIPTNLFFLVLSITAIIYYIVQIILSFKFFKPSETTPPSFITAILFYAADSLVFIAAILYFCSASGVNNFYTTLTSLDTVVPRVTYSFATSLSSIFDDGIPSSVNPIFQVVIDILNSTKNFLSTTTNSFLTPTSIFLEKMSSSDESNLGVFAIYNERIQPKANEFYDKASQYPKLDDISDFFFKQNFSSYQESIQNLYRSVQHLSNQVNSYVSFFEYMNEILYPLQQSIFSLTDRTLDESNYTLGDFLDDLKNQSLSSFEYLTEVRQEAKNKSKVWKVIETFYFISGIIFLASPVVFGLVFMMHSSLSVCIANTISICPLVSTILMFFASFLATGIGFALVALSNQLEQRVDGFIGEALDHAFPGSEIVFPPINVTKNTNGTYKGVLRLSKIVFPSPITSFEHFVNSDEEDGIATSLDLNSVIDMNKYANELSAFVSQVGNNFVLSPLFVQSLKQVETALSYLSNMPTQIDGFFQWGVPMTESTNCLRDQIKSMDPDAFSQLDPYLKEIDAYSVIMNHQFKEAIYQLSNVLPNSLDQLSSNIVIFIKKIVDDLSKSLNELVRNVYPLIDSIKVGLVIGPYALVRNLLFYDLSSACAYISASGTLMICGLIPVVTMIWIRRKYMLPDSKGWFKFFELKCRKEKVENSNDENTNSSQFTSNIDETEKEKSAAIPKKCVAEKPKSPMFSSCNIDSSNDYAPSTDGDTGIGSINDYSNNALFEEEEEEESNENRKYLEKSLSSSESA